jgi:Na+/melibiose symporter-like transporter
MPHLALGAELSTDYHQRSVVMSYGTLFAVVGGAGTFFFGWAHFEAAGGVSVRAAYPSLGAVVGTVSAAAILISAFSTRDQIPRLMQPTAAAGERFGLARMLKEIRECVQNRNYLMMLLGLFFVSATAGTRETVNSYSNLFFWELPPAKIKIFALASPIGFILAFFVTVWLHRAFDKRRTMIGALCLMTFSYVTPVLARFAGLMPSNQSPRLLPILALAVFGFYLATAVLTISALSALADIADEHELNTGRRQEGVFYAARTFFAKLSSAFGHIIAGIALDVIHFPKGAQPGQLPHDTVSAIGLLDGPIGAIPGVISIFFYAAYRIDKHRHTQIALALQERRKQNASVATASVGAPAAVGGVEPAAF